MDLMIDGGDSLSRWMSGLCQSMWSTIRVPNDIREVDVAAERGCAFTSDSGISTYKE
jgi:hypothetical protein